MCTLMCLIKRNRKTKSEGKKQKRDTDTVRGGDPPIYR